MSYPESSCRLLGIGSLTKEILRAKQVRKARKNANSSFQLIFQSRHVVTSRCYFAHFLDWTGYRFLVLLQRTVNQKTHFFFSSPETPGYIGTDEDLGAKKGYGVVSH